MSDFLKTFNENLTDTSWNAGWKEQIQWHSEIQRPIWWFRGKGQRGQNPTIFMFCSGLHGGTTWFCPWELDFSEYFPNGLRVFFRISWSIFPISLGVFFWIYQPRELDICIILHTLIIYNQLKLKDHQPIWILSHFL